MFKLIGILILIYYFGYIAYEYGVSKIISKDEEIVYRHRPTTDLTNLGNESFLRTHYDMFQKNPLLYAGEYTQELLDTINDNLDIK
jgi:hypothetical protein